MNDRDEPNNSSDSEAIYRAPTSDTGFAPGTDALAAYVGPKNADYYENVFNRFRNQGSSLSWNWPAFFISSVWLLYRKMWLNAFLYWIALPVALSAFSMVIAAIAGDAASGLFYYTVYVLIAFVLLPMFANRLYYQHAQNKVSRVASAISSPEQQSAELARIGGTSNVVLVVIPFFVIALAGMLAAIAIPAYQDYTIRAQVSEGLNLAGGPKAAVAEYFRDTGDVPRDNASAGLLPAERISGKYVSSVTVADGEVIVTYGNDAHAAISGATLVLSPYRESADILQWDCGSTSIQVKHLPAACRRPL